MTEHQDSLGDIPTASSIPPPPVPMSPNRHNDTGIRNRPRSVTVIAIVLFAIAGLSLSLFAAKFFTRMPRTNESVFDLIEGCILLIMAIGLWCQSRWARKGCIIALSVMLLVDTAANVYKLLVVPLVPMIRLHAESRMSLLILDIVALVVGVAFEVALYGSFIFFLTRPNVVAAFQQKVVSESHE